MGMRMMFIVFLLVVLATTVVSFTLDRVLGLASEGRNAKAIDNALDQRDPKRQTPGCCWNPACGRNRCGRR
uniref:Conotoxin superfamily A n=1 Tax=Conus ermineus TaxID=55423 RepID=A0A346CJ43_CONER|nr:conotoxin precursor superfamily A [Conus ermineus]